MKEKFLVGAATAAHQVEGNNTHSDFWTMEHLKHSDFIEPSNLACDHYNRYKEDIKLLSDARCNAYRFSIEWARIEPKEDFFDEKEIGHYKNVLLYCKENGITPIVTLMHFSSPAWLITKGGWANEYVVGAFKKYVKKVIEELGDLIPYVCTINEANMGLQLNKIASDMMKANKRKEGSVQVGQNTKIDLKSIILGMFEKGRAFKCSPFKVNTYLMPRNKEKELIVMKVHNEASKVIKDINSNIKVGLTLSLYDYQVVAGGEDMAKKLWDEDFGLYLPYIKNDDFLGVQNYTRKIVDANGNKEPELGAPITQMGYEEYPYSIGNLLMRVSKEFHNELIVTENGIATDDDSRRCEFIKKAFNSVIDAKKSGVNVKGYLYWSLLDNFEWQAGFSKTFGLIAVDRKTMERYPKESLKVLGNLGKEYNNEQN